MEKYVFPVQIQSLPQMKERVEQTIAAVSTVTLKEVWKNMNSEINHTIRVNGGLIEQQSI